jgi:hypothetical protein
VHLAVYFEKMIMLLMLLNGDFIMSSKELYTHRRREYWQDIIDKWKVSNLSGKRFCDEQGLALPTFYKWRRKLDYKAIEDKQQAPTFLEVSLDYNRSADVEIKLPAGSVIRISNSANAHLLTRVFTSLRESGLC